MQARRITEQLSQHLDLFQTHWLVWINVDPLLRMGNVDGDQRRFEVQQSLPVTGKRVFVLEKLALYIAPPFPPSFFQLFLS